MVFYSVNTTRTSVASDNFVVEAEFNLGSRFSTVEISEPLCRFRLALEDVIEATRTYAGKQ